MVTIPKISLGKKSKRSYFDLTHDVNTTSDFGFCQPTICREFYKDSKISLQSKQFVRLGAMPCPTFGRIEVKTHTAFVPVNDVFIAYDYLQSQKSITSANRSYIPQCADYVTANTLLGSVLEMVCDASSYYEHTGNVFRPFNLDETRFLGRFSLWMMWKDFCPSDYTLYSQHGEYELVDVINDSVIISDQKLVNNSLRVLVQVLTNNADNANISSSSWYSYWSLSTIFNRVFGKTNTKTGSIGTYYNKMFPINFATFTSADRLQPQSVFATGFGKTVQDSWIDLQYLQQYPDFLSGMSNVNADFRFGSFHISYQDEWEHSITDAPVFINFHLSRSGKRLFKVLTGCRVSFGTKKKKIDLMRLLSYYKVWFDKYNPGRNLQWLDTNAFGLIHGYYDFGSVLDNIINATGPDYSRINSAGILARYLAFWYNFLYDLPQCTYVLPVDNMTCATATPLLEIDNNSNSINSLDFYSNNSSVSSVTGVNMDNTRIYGDIAESEDAGGLGIQLLSRIYHLVNKNSVIGSKIDEYLRSHNISRGLPHSNVLGDSKFMCNIDDVFATAGTSESALGEYAGKGIGSGSSNTMHFETECFGYLIQLLCVVPLGGYVQGMRDCPINRYDFYQSEFDSLGMEPMSKSNFLNRRYDYTTFANDDSIFGFRPRYFGLKIENNLANGGFALRSLQSEFLPYSLDRLFSLKTQSLEPEDYVADEELRYIGRYEKFGNYDRIFYDTTGASDNFIIHMIQDLSMYAPMKSISDSYDTFDKDVDDTNVNVEKA